MDIDAHWRDSQLLAAEVAYAKKRPCCPFAATDMAFDRSFESFPLVKYAAALYKKLACLPEKV